MLPFVSDQLYFFTKPQSSKVLRQNLTAVLPNGSLQNRTDKTERSMTFCAWNAEAHHVSILHIQERSSALINRLPAIPIALLTANLR